MEIYNSDLAQIEKLIQLGGRAFLEIGCGDGRLAAMIADTAASVIAIDPDAPKIEAARGQSKGVKFLVGSGENLPFEAGAFDIVLFSYSLHHQDCRKALAEAKRVLRPEGRMLVIEPASDGEFTRFVSVFEKDEITRIRKTLSCLIANRLQILRQDEYHVPYSFQDESELYNYFTKNFMTVPDASAAEKMAAILGGKLENRLIIIKDRVNIFLLGNMRSLS